MATSKKSPHIPEGLCGDDARHPEYKFAASWKQEDVIWYITCIKLAGSLWVRHSV
jgi:hypothetical protein